MKKTLLSLLFAVVLGIAAFVIVKDLKSIKLIADTPSENITGVMATVTCDGNSVLVMPEKGTHK